MLIPSPDFPIQSPLSNMSNTLANVVCQRCQACFTPADRIVNSNGELYHEHCFVYAQWFWPFPEGLFYEVRMFPGPQPAAFSEPQPLTQLQVCPPVSPVHCTWLGS